MRLSGTWSGRESTGGAGHREREEGGAEVPLANSPLSSLARGSQETITWSMQPTCIGTAPSPQQHGS